MSHYFTDGFSVRQPMWHGLGTVLPEYPDIHEAISLAGQDWNVLEYDVLATPRIPGWETDGPEYLAMAGYASEVPGWVAITREDTGEVLNVARSSYEPIQNTVGWDIIEALLGQGAKAETAGVLKGGAVCWALLLLDEPVVINGDNSYTVPYMLVTWTHDGTGAFRILRTRIRVVCWNTLSMAIAGSASTFTFRHTKNVLDRIEDSKDAILGTRKDFSAFVELANELAGVYITDPQREEFVRRFVPEPSTSVEVTERVFNNIMHARDQVRSIFDGPTIPDEHRNTAYGLYQAGVEYLDHYRGTRSKETVFKRTLMTTDKQKAALLPLVRDVVGSPS